MRSPWGLSPSSSERTGIHSAVLCHQERETLIINKSYAKLLVTKRFVLAVCPSSSLDSQASKQTLGLERTAPGFFIFASKNGFTGGQCDVFEAQPIDSGQAPSHTQSTPSAGPWPVRGPPEAQCCPHPQQGHGLSRQGETHSPALLGGLPTGTHF